MILAIAATIIGAFSMIYTKYLFQNKNVDYLPFTVQQFWAIMFTLLPGIFIFPFPKITHFLDIFLFLLLIATGCFWNILYYHGLKKETLVESQLIIMIVPLISSFSGFLFFSEERKISSIILLGIGISALIWAHISHHQLYLHKGSWYIAVAGVFAGIESIIIKLLVPVFSSYWLYFARIVGITILITLLFRRAAIPSSKTIAAHMLAIGFIVGIQFVLIYESYAKYGLVYSNLILSLLPVVTAYSGHVIFREKISKKQFIAGLVLFTCVIIAQFF